jgi:hypothetical protein
MLSTTEIGKFGVVFQLLPVGRQAGQTKDICLRLISSGERSRSNLMTSLQRVQVSLDGIIASSAHYVPALNSGWV